MNRCKFALTMGGGLVLSLAGMVNADDALRQEVAQLRQEVATLKGQSNGGALDQRRADEIKGLIQEVLSDADTRASLMADGAVAGHDGTNFFLSSVDGSQRLNFWGQIQFRYIVNIDNDEVDNGEEIIDDSEDEGFDMRRVKLGFNGHVTAGRKFEYEVILAMSRGSSDSVISTEFEEITIPGSSGGGVFVEDAKFGTQLTDSLRVDFGKFKLPFLREELISSKRMLTAERSSVNEFFTLNRAEQVQLSYKSDMIKVAGAVSDGSNSEFSVIGGDMVELSLTGRVDVKLAGDWGQAADTTAWSGQPFGLFLGGAVHYQMGDGSNGGSVDYLSWTVDVSVETGGFGIFAALIGAHPDTDDDIVTTDNDPIGFVVQGSYNINDTIEPFVRFEWLDPDVDDVDELMILTGGVNYYISKNHNAKVTLDVLWVMEANDSDVSSFPSNSFGASAFGTGNGFSDGDGHGEDNLIIRLQFQLLF